MKTCMYCKQSKDESEFGIDGSRKSGLSFSCKACRNEKSAESYQRRRETLLQKKAEYRDRTRERAREMTAIWSRKNPDARNASRNAYRSRKLGACGSYSAKDIKALMGYQKGKCAICNISLAIGKHVDHITPLSSGGSNGRFNLQLLCPSCNLRKSDKDPIEFAQSLGRLL